MYPFPHFMQEQEGVDWPKRRTASPTAAALA